MATRQHPRAWARVIARIVTTPWYVWFGLVWAAVVAYGVANPDCCWSTAALDDPSGLLYQEPCP